MLNECYFCGNDEVEICGGGSVWYASCPSCSAEGPIASTKIKAGEAWNRAKIAKFPEVKK